MSDSADAHTPSGGELQFDRAEFAAPASAATCKVCGKPMHDLYYEVNGLPFCQSCRQQLQSARDVGSGAGRFARAALYGSLAGVAGAIIYYAVREVANIEFGLISIIVGLMIGKAVKKGSNARGGWLYQGLAMFLTYSAIVATYVPPIITIIRDRADENAAAVGLEEPDGADGAAQAPAEAAADRPAVAEPKPPLSTGTLVMALVSLVGLAYAIPVLVGFSSPMSLIIVAIGLYEAWSLNRRLPIVVHGPFQIGKGIAEGTVHVEPAG
ncbi:MAG TPA: LIM domain-containing protein [Pirellulales bacterium]|nr:LIM domain-containing protein [Pirellulales bacterium]